MKAIILAAGYATRLYPLSENQPKPLLPIKGKPILEYILDDIQNIPEITEIILVSNAKFYRHFTAWKKNYPCGLPIRIISDGSMTNETRLGAIMDLDFAVTTMNIHSDILVLAGDNIYDFSMKGFVDFFMEHQTDMIMVHEETNIENLRKTGVAELEGNKIISFEEKPAEPKSHFAVPPFYIYKTETLPLFAEYIHQGLPSDAPGNFIAWLCKQKTVFGYKMPGHRYDIGDINSYLSVNDIFQN